jgi:hypothetical protein
MATYIQGLTDYIPKAEPYKPDFDFLNTVLSTRQARYDSALNQLSGAYGSIIYADLTRDDNKVARDNFLKNSEKAIQQITTLDLSNPANVQAAQQVFQPFVDDKKMQYDVMFTKGVKTGQQYGESLRTSSNEDMHAKWSPVSDKGLQYKQLEFKSASQDKAYRMPIPKYVNNVNIMTKAQELVGDDFKNIKIEKTIGGYDVTTTGGEAAKPVIAQFLSMALGQDPDVQAYYNELSYVNAMSGITQLADSKYEGNIEQASAEYYISNADKFLKNDVNRLEDIEDGYLQYQSKVDVYESKINRGSKLTPKEEQDYQATVAKRDGYNKAKTNLTDRISQMQTAIDTEDIDLLSRAIRSSDASSYIANEIGKAAEPLAYRNYQVEKKANEFEKSKFDKALDFSYWTKQEKIRQGFEREMKMLEVGGADDFSVGATKGEAAVEDAYVGDRAEYNNSWQSFGGSVYELTNTITSINDPKLNSAVGNILKSTGYNMDQLKKGNISLTALNKIFNGIQDSVKADPQLAKNLGPLIIKANDKRQLAYSNVAALNSNNKVIAANMKASKDYVPAFVDYVFGQDGSLRDANSAYKQALQSNANINRDAFMDDYEDFIDDYQNKYTDLAKNKTGYKVVGTAGPGSYTSNYIQGIADFGKPASKVTMGLKSALGDALNNESRISIGSANDIAAASDRSYIDIEDNTILRGYLNNLITNARAEKKTVRYDYQGRALGSQGFHALTVRPLASDPDLKALKEAGAIDDKQYNKIISSGITAIIPSNQVTNPIANRLTKTDREVILDNVGTYRYVNPNGNIDVTFNKKNDGSITASGTAYNSRTGGIETYVNNNLNIISFSTLLNNFDAIK